MDGSLFIAKCFLLGAFALLVIVVGWIFCDICKQMKEDEVN